MTRVGMLARVGLAAACVAALLTAAGWISGRLEAEAAGPGPATSAGPGAHG